MHRAVVLGRWIDCIFVEIFPIGSLLHIISIPRLFLPDCLDLEWLLSCLPGPFVDV